MSTSTAIEEHVFGMRLHHVTRVRKLSIKSFVNVSPDAESVFRYKNYILFLAEMYIVD